MQEQAKKGDGRIIINQIKQVQLVLKDEAKR